MRSNQVQDENVSAPSSDHVKVGESGEYSVVIRVTVIGSERSNPKVKRQHHGRDSDALIVVAATDRSGEMRGHNGHDEHGEHAGFDGWRTKAERKWIMPTNNNRTVFVVWKEEVE